MTPEVAIAIGFWVWVASHFIPFLVAWFLGWRIAAGVVMLMAAACFALVKFFPDDSASIADTVGITLFVTALWAVAAGVGQVVHQRQLREQK